MGKGDMRTRRGKIFRGSHGKTRLRKSAKKKSKIKGTAPQKTSPKAK